MSQQKDIEKIKQLTDHIVKLEKETAEKVKLEKKLTESEEQDGSMKHALIALTALLRNQHQNKAETIYPG